MPWYENPTVAAVLGGLAGAIITGIISLFIWRRTHKIKRVDCIINDVSSLLIFSEKIKDKLEVKYEGKKADSVYLHSMEIVNTGDEAVTHQPVRIRLEKEANIVDYSFETEPEVGFGEVIEKQREKNALDLEILLLNPKDRITLEIFSLDNQNESINVYMKNANVRTRVYSRKSAEDVLAAALGDKTINLLPLLISVIPGFGFFRSLFLISLSQRIDQISRNEPNNK